MIRTTMLCLILGLVAGTGCFNSEAQSQTLKGATWRKSTALSPENLLQAKVKADVSIDSLRLGTYFWGEEVALDDLKEKVVLVQIAGL